MKKQNGNTYKKMFKRKANPPPRPQPHSKQLDGIPLCAVSYW
jgi:hypothetical protein